MTIAAGFIGTDGILLATDTLYSGGQQRKFGPKMWVIQTADPVVVLAVSGYEATIDRMLWELEDRVIPGKSLTWTLDQIDVVLKRMHHKFSGGDQVELQVLVAVQTMGVARLYHAKGHFALAPVTEDSACIGADALGGYFAKSLFRPHMRMFWARIVAAHLVKSCKDYASDYCGGDTHLIEVPHTGEVRHIYDQTRIQRYENHLKEAHTVMSWLLPSPQTDLNAEAAVLDRVDAVSELIRGITLKMPGMTLYQMSQYGASTMAHYGAGVTQPIVPPLLTTSQDPQPPTDETSDQKPSPE